MRLAWAIVAGLLLGAGVAWWFAADAPGKREAGQQYAGKSAAAVRDDRPSLYRWRDDAGVLQITDKPPQGRPFERLDRDVGGAIVVKGERGD
ncbi:MAG TPA: DUF4124 domain-containing protein [Pseudoxanthomonas sp.]|nr:DUF4124 domain-containing protein [Pseudoxanthomonas sp.]